MCSIAIDALVLIVLLKSFDEEDIGFGFAFLIALGAAVGTYALAFGLSLALGTAGIVLAAFIAAALLGVAVSALFGVELKRSLLIGAIFMFVHIAVGVGIQMLLQRP